VASTVFERMVLRGAVKSEDFRIIYRSPLFPTASFAYAHDLKPDLAKKITDCFFAFHFPPEMVKEFQDGDRFQRINYQQDWAVVREVAEKSGTPYNRAAYDAEARREADALAKSPQPLPAPKQ
jgi:phosphonate transport system substrate-binding protein